MPLPDERPRQSVANLIGRFEIQSKRQPSAATPPRSSSVISHTTGDSTKEELKEKREWPPKPVTEPASVLPPPSSFRLKSPQTQPGPLPTTTDPPAPPATANGTSGAKPEATDVPPEAVPTSTQPEMQEVQPPPQPPKPAPSKARTPPSPVKPTTSRTTPSAPKTAIRSVSTPKTPAKPAASSPPTQPLKPQHTGQSTTSTSTKKPSIKPTPSTPARPKTPARTSVTPARTPSSGLYAPTAASLARSRNTPASTPTPVKKPTPSTSAADRLSKPTAASLSRARSPATTPSKTATLSKVATTPAKPAARGSGTSRTTPGRGGKTPTTSSRADKSGDAKPAADLVFTQEAPMVTSTTTADATAVLDEEAVIENPQPVGETTPAPEHEAEVEAEAEAAVEEHPTQSSPEPEIKVVVSDEEDPAPSGHETLSTSPQPEAEAEREPEHEDLQESLSVSGEPANETVEESADIATDELAALASKHDGTDLEHIVNLLETMPVPGAISVTAGTPSEMQEIPDEE